MDPAEIRFIRKVFLKERGAKVFRKLLPYPTLWESFKDSRHLVHLLVIRERIVNVGTKFIALLATEEQCINFA